MTTQLTKVPSQKFSTHPIQPNKAIRTTEENLQTLKDENSTTALTALRSDLAQKTHEIESLLDQMKTLMLQQKQEECAKHEHLLNSISHLRSDQSMKSMEIQFIFNQLSKLLIMNRHYLSNFVQEIQQKNSMKIQFMEVELKKLLAKSKQTPKPTPITPTLSEKTKNGNDPEPPKKIFVVEVGTQIVAPLEETRQRQKTPEKIVQKTVVEIGTQIVAALEEAQKPEKVPQKIVVVEVGTQIVAPLEEVKKGQNIPQKVQQKVFVVEVGTQIMAPLQEERKREKTPEKIPQRIPEVRRLPPQRILSLVEHLPIQIKKTPILKIHNQLTPIQVVPVQITKPKKKPNLDVHKEVTPIQIFPVYIEKEKSGPQEFKIKHELDILILQCEIVKKDLQKSLEMAIEVKKDLKDIKHDKHCGNCGGHVGPQRQATFSFRNLEDRIFEQKVKLGLSELFDFLKLNPSFKRCKYDACYGVFDTEDSQPKCYKCEKRHCQKCQQRVHLGPCKKIISKP